MNSISLFLLKSVVVSAILTTWYLFGLRNSKLHNYNRFFLLFTLLASIVVPCLHFQWFPVNQDYASSWQPASFLLHAVNDNEEEMVKITKHAATVTDWNILAFIIVAIISSGLLTILLLRVVWVFRMSKKYMSTRMQGAYFINTNLDKAPFSFLNYLFWKDTISLETENGRLIYEHEMAHIKQKHTYDKLACQLLTCIFWMNPFYWFIQKELSVIHEFIADGKAINENDTTAFASMLLQTHNNGNYLIPEHQFFSSPIKRRLIMLQTSKKTNYAWLRQTMVLPLAAGAILIFSFTPVPVRKNTVQADKKIILVLDAGHGGSDIGVHYEALVEKDINLKIAKRIQALSRNYNIETHLTRDKDESLSLPERVEISNKLHADDFISIHVTDDAGRDMQNGNFDIAISSKNPKLKESEVLGGAILQRINREGGIQKKTPSEKSLYVLRKNNAPSVLIEFGDITNKDHNQWITNEVKLDELCIAVLQGVVDAHK